MGEVILNNFMLVSAVSQIRLKPLLFATEPFFCADEHISETGMYIR
jgi:hypothetical protein